MENDKPLMEELARWLYTDTLIYQCLKMQAETGLSDRNTLVALVTMMADRNAQIEQRLMDCMARLPAPIVRLI